MIEWMQKHKKSLIPTIWVSTIAFVGAGFVGWGAYDMNANRAGSIARVGQISITNQELNTKYSDLYNRLSAMSDGQFTQEQAQNMHLDQIAVDQLIGEAYFLNFAKDLGLRANEKDVADFVLNSPNFQENGAFSKELYDNVVKNSGLTKKEFERNLQKTLTLQKLGKALQVAPDAKIIEAFAASQLMQDKVSAQIVYADANVTFSDDELKNFWEGEKSRFMTEKKYTLGTYFVAPSNADVNETELSKFYEEHRGEYRSLDDKLLNFTEAKNNVLKDYRMEQSKKSATKDYLEIKKGKIETNETIVATAENFPIAEIELAKQGDVVKPFEYKGGFLIAKLNGIEQPRQMNFEEARASVAKEFEEKKRKELLEKRAQDALKNFKGTDFGTLSLSSKNTTKLSDDEFYKFLIEMFGKPAKEGVVVFDNKAVAYKILEQNLGDSAAIDKEKALVADRIAALLNSNLQDDLTKMLEKRYKTERYFKGKDSE